MIEYDWEGNDFYDINASRLNINSVFIIHERSSNFKTASQYPYEGSLYIRLADGDWADVEYNEIEVFVDFTSALNTAKEIFDNNNCHVVFFNAGQILTSIFVMEHFTSDEIMEAVLRR